MDKIKVPTYNVLEDMPEELQAIIEEQGVVKIAPSFNTKYMLTYGTLRWGLGNWKWCFKGRTKHLRTIAMAGYLKNNGISCQFTHDPNHVTVMDLFEITEVEGKDNFSDVNSDTDGLEGVYWGRGGYESTAVALTHNDTDIIAKFYNADWTKDLPEKSEKDYAVSTYVAWKKQMEEAGELEKWTKELTQLVPGVVAFYPELFEKKDKQINETVTE